MKPDLYTKIVLTVIAFMLTIIACNRYVSPATTARAEGPFAGVQFSVGDGFYFFDGRTGQVWHYATMVSPGKVLASYRLTQLGQPLVKER
jgi:hypothetical protein